MPAQRFDQALLSELFSLIVEGFGYAVRIQSEGVSRAELAFANRAIPVFKKTKNGAGGIKAFESAIAT